MLVLGYYVCLPFTVSMLVRIPGNQVDKNDCIIVGQTVLQFLIKQIKSLADVALFNIFKIHGEQAEDAALGYYTKSSVPVCISTFQQLDGPAVGIAGERRKPPYVPLVFGVEIVGLYVVFHQFAAVPFLVIYRPQVHEPIRVAQGAAGGFDGIFGQRDGLVYRRRYDMSLSVYIMLSLRIGGRKVDENYGLIVG